MIEGGLMKSRVTVLLAACLVAVVLLGTGAAPALAHAQTIVVHPSGDDDTAAIQAAFAAAGPGGTVQLTKGHFYMNNILVQSFKGCFRGAGMGRTVIDSLRGLGDSRPGITLMVDPENPGTVDEPNYLTGWTFLIGFLRSDVRVADMSFDITAAEPSLDYESNGGTNVSDVLSVGRASNSSFDRVGIQAHSGDVNGLNIEGALAIWDTGGTHSVTRCCFSSNSGPEIGYLTGARLTVGGSPAMGNRIDVYSFGGYFTDFSASCVDISHNWIRAATGGGVYVQQASDAPPAPARFSICDNRIVANMDVGPDGSVWGAAGVILEDDPWTEDAPDRLDAVVAGNRIELDNGGRAGGIDGFGTHGVCVTGNRISGTGISGIDTGTDIYAEFGYPAAPSDHWRIVDNDVSDLDLVNDYGGLVAPIWLGKGSSQCLVVGGCRPTSVLDQGTDNVLIHVIRLSGPSLTASRAAAPASAPGGKQALPNGKSL
jgi:hypothetical protein